MNWFFLAFTATFSALFAAAAIAFLLRSALLNWGVDRVLVRLLKDTYSENMWDVVTGMTRVPPHILLELELRAESGKTLERPLGTVRQLPDFAGVAFNPAQLVRLPLGPQEPVDLTTVIGPRSRSPLRLEMPVMISALAYGVALSKPFVLGLARGATLAGTSYNAGSGPLPDEVRRDAARLVLQYSGGAWNRKRDVLATADMVEIRYGHGSRAATGNIIPASALPPDARRLMGVPEGGQAVHEAPLPGAATPADLRRLVAELRQLIGGRPVGVKLAATHDLEQELAAALAAGVDVITIDGAQGGTHGTPPIIADDFGIPTIHALHRSVRFLERSGSRRDVSLIISGGLRTPGEFLKALALGADAVNIGTAALMACTHGQVSKAVPFEPITQLCWADGKYADRFDPDEGAKNLANFLRSCAGELAEAARALGKRAIHEVGRADLLARDRETADVLGLPPSWLPADERWRSQREAGERETAAQPDNPVPPWEPPLLH